MSKYCIIKNPDHISPMEVAKLIHDGVYNQTRVKSDYHFDKKNSFLEIRIKDLCFPIFVNRDGSFSMYSSPQDGLLENQRTLYFKNYFKTDHPYLNGYGYLHEYVKEFLAFSLKTEVDCEVGGLYKPFSKNPNRFESLETWLNHYAKSRVSFLKRTILFFKYPPLWKIKREEKIKFSEFWI